MTDGRLGTCIMVKGWLLLALAAVHCAVLPGERARIAALASGPVAREHAIYFGGMGLCIALMAAMDLLAAPAIRRGQALGLRLALLSAAASTAAGGVGTAAFRLSPPTTMLAVGAPCLAALAWRLARGAAAHKEAL